VAEDEATKKEPVEPAKELVFTPSTLRPLHEDCLRHRKRLAECFGAPPFDQRIFTIWQCGQCGLGFTDPIPTSESAYLLYETRESNDFQPGDTGLAAQLKNLASMRDVRSFSNGLTLPANAKMLDFSCGNGAFAHALQRTWPSAKVFGSDTHAEPPQGMTCSYLPNYSLSALQGTLDFILCRHVLEHTYDPVGLIAFLSSLLVPGGVLVVEVPSLETPVARLFSKYWDGYYAPFHPLHFTRASLASTIRAGGLKVIKEGGAEMPKMGRSLRNILGCEYNLALFAAGVLLQPLQVAIGAISRKPMCLRVWGKKPIGTP
jgi:SAM-dependent methyltransferase